MINRVVLVGRLTKEPDLKYTTNGIANLRFSLAVNRSYSGQNGERQADFINCVAWRGQAENMTKFLHKGSLIGVEGRIETGSYQAQDGSTRYTTDVICESVQFLEPKKNSQPNSQEAGFQGQQVFNTPSAQPVTNPFDPGFATPPSQNYSQPFATATAMAGSVGTSNPLININDDDLPF